MLFGFDAATPPTPNRYKQPFRHTQIYRIQQILLILLLGLLKSETKNLPNIRT
jgi:hypothetical protein